MIRSGQSILKKSANKSVESVQKNFKINPIAGRILFKDAGGGRNAIILQFVDFNFA